MIKIFLIILCIIVISIVIALQITDNFSNNLNLKNKIKNKYKSKLKYLDLPEFKQLCRDNVDRNNNLSVMMFNKGHIEEARNSIHTYYKNVGKNLIVLVLDKDTQIAMNRHNIPCYYNKNIFNINGNEFNFGTDEFRTLTYLKLLPIYKILILKYNVLWIDTDIVFFKDPFKYFDKIKKSIILQNDLNDNNNKEYLCSGFMYYRYNKISLNYLSKCVNFINKYYPKRCPVEDKNWNNAGEQNIINKFKNLNDIHVLPIELFPNGKVYFEDKLCNDIEIYIIHNNWIAGLDNKINRFKENNLWFIVKPISKIIFQTFKNKDLIGNIVYKNIKKYAPEYKHVIYDDRQCIQFLKKYNHKLHKENLVNIFKQLNGPHKADLIRYCYLYINGGIYLDIKTKLIKNINNIFNRKNTLYTVISPHSQIYQGIIASPPNNPLFLELIEYIVKKYKNIDDYHMFCHDFYNRICKYTNENNLKNKYYKNLKYDIDFYLFEEKIEDNKVCQQLNERLDLYNLCTHIYDKNEIIVNTRYDKTIWKGNDTGFL